MNMQSESDLSQPIERPFSDTISALPRAYGDAPQLGAALPGDLGPPILKGQQLDDQAAEAGYAGGDQIGRNGPSVVDERRAARESGVLFQRGSSSARSDRVAMADGAFRAGVTSGAARALVIRLSARASINSRQSPFGQVGRSA